MSKDLSRVRILIVEDMPDSRLVLRNLLESLGASEIKECMDGATARSELQKEGFDLVLSDWEMPNLSGLELLRFLRQNGLQPQTPFIMITGNADEDKVLKGMREGVSDYIVKPFDSEVVIKKIKEALMIGDEPGRNADHSAEQA